MHLPIILFVYNHERLKVKESSNGWDKLTLAHT